MSLFSSFKKKKLEKRLKKRIFDVLNLPVDRIMSKFVITIQKNESLEEAGQMIVGEKISCVVVKNKERPIGVVTERDFVKKGPVNEKDYKSMKVNNLMSPKLITITPETTVTEAIQLLIKNNFRKLVIENKAGVMIGVVTQTDFTRLFDKFYNHLTIKTEDLLNIKDVMSKKVVSVKKNAKFEEAKKKMAQNNVGCVVVSDNKKLSGIITEFDIVAEIVENAKECKNKRVEKIMISPVITINTEPNIFEANRLMVQDNVRRLPIYENNELKGIVTQTDLCRSIFSFLQKTDWKIYKNKLEWEPLEKEEPETELI